MPRLLIVALLAAISLSVSAQTHLADSSGVYFGISPAYSNASGLLGTSVALGYRQSNGVDYGLGFQMERRALPTLESSDYLGASMGATLGYTHDLGSDFRLRLESAAGYRTVSYDYNFQGDSRDFYGSALIGDLSATVSRPVRVIGSFKLHPTIGLFANASHVLSENATGYEGRPPTLGETDMGIQIGMPISFRAFGADVTIPLMSRTSFSRQPTLTSPNWVPSLGLRANF